MRRKNERGVILLYTLIILSVTVFITLAYFEFAAGSLTASRREANALKARWIAHGIMERTMAMIQRNDLSPAHAHDSSGKYADGLWQRVVRGNSDGCVITVTGTCSGVSHTLSNALRLRYFSDYAMTCSGSRIIEMTPETSFPVLIAGTADIIARSYRSDIYIPAFAQHRPVTAGKVTITAGISNASIRIKRYGTSLRDIRTIQECRADSAAVDILADRIGDVPIPPLDAIWKRAREMHPYLPDDMPTQNTISIINPYLTRKVYFAAGKTMERRYACPKPFISGQRIYILPAAGHEPAMPVDPYRFADAYGTEHSFTVTPDAIVFNPPEHRYAYGCSPAGIATLNTFPLATEGYNNISEARGIDDVFIDGIQLSGNAFVRTGHALRILQVMPYVKFIGYGDGRKTDFATPHAAAPFVFVNEMRVSAYQAATNIMRFGIPPAYGSKITCYEKLPSLSFTKRPLDTSHSLYTDTAVTMRRIMLNAIPGQNTIVSDRPLYLEGRASRKVTVITTDDVYLGDIDGSIVSIYARAVFTTTADVRAHVFLYTQHDGLYPLSGMPASITGSIVSASVLRTGNFVNRLKGEPHVFTDSKTFPVSVRLSDIYAKDKEPLFFAIHDAYRGDR
ncbi:MAG: hypothetical protein HZC28_15730 [Spirochaetes bacterium]|nr:hypothetical protein [Spirochaetota bacterium]